MELRMSAKEDWLEDKLTMSLDTSQGAPIITSST